VAGKILALNLKLMLEASLPISPLLLHLLVIHPNQG